jgi:hypothetical protein
MGLKDLAGFRCSEFSLARQKVDVHAFLSEIGVVRKLAQAGFNHFLGLLDFSLLDEPMGLPGEALLGA